MIALAPETRACLASLGASARRIETGVSRRSPGQEFTAETLLELCEPDLNTGCLLWSRATNLAGYGQATFHRKAWGAHRLSWTLHNGPIPPGYCVCHKCDTPPCINPQHLFLGTNLENSRDMVRKGRARTIPRVGEKASRVVLKEVQVLEILRLYPTISRREISNRYNIAKSTVRAIITGKSWAYLANRGRS